MIEIANTGERILPDKETPMMVARHLSAYKFTQGYVPGKKALDIGCGEGYGTHYLSGYAGDITGIDYSPEAIAHAKEKYQNKNTHFEVVDVKQIAQMRNSFDVICCFQVIEHIKDTASFLTAIKSLLADGGTFVCSTPNKIDASPDTVEPVNKFHVREYLLDEFTGLLKPYFSEVRMFGLKRNRGLNFYRRLKKIGLFNFLPEKTDPVKRFYTQIHTGNFNITEKRLSAALDFIAVCRK